MSEEKKQEKPAEKPKEEQAKEAPKEEKSKEAPKEEKQAAPKAPSKKNVNYVYGALLLHSAGKKIDEAGLKKVVDAAGVSADPAQVKALVASLEGVDIDEAIKQSVVSAAPAASTPAAGEEKKEEKDDKADEKKAEEAAAGLSSLFG